MSSTNQTGLVTRYQAGYYVVQNEMDTLVCKLRGRLKRGPAVGDLVAIGDHVHFLRLSDGTGVIEKVEPRRRALVRKSPTPGGVYEQVLLANPDQAVLVFSCAKPEPHLRMLDRFLVICEREGIPPLIVANKVDLIGQPAAQEIFAPYPPLGYPVIFTSAISKEGVHVLHEHITGKISALAGPSGVGKTSLLNAIQPLLGKKVKTVSKATSKGRHSTVVRELIPLDGGGYVADLPGLRALELWDIEPEELDGYFPELRPLVQFCQFNDCTHRSEPGCAVRQAVSEGKIHPERHQSYLRMRFGDSIETELSNNLT